MATDFNYGNKTINSSGPIKPSGKDMPSDPRTRVNTYADIESIPNPYVGMLITVKEDETNSNKMTDYKVLSLKANASGIANSVIDQVQRYVDYLDVSSGLTDEEKTTLTNLKATVGDTTSGLVKDVNDLKENGVSQDNITAAVNDYFTNNPITIVSTKDIYADNNMPTVFITSNTLTTLNKKADGTSDCKFEIRFKRQIITCYGTGAIQGTSSASFPAKNYTFKFYSDETHTNKFKINIGWGDQNKYCFKKNYVDSTHTRNISGARIAYDMVNSRPESDFKTNLLNTPHNGSIDGFPIKVYINGEFWGIYTWNIPKDAWMFNMDDSNPNHMVLCAEYNNNGNDSSFNTCEFRNLWGGEQDANWSIEVGTYSDTLKNSFNNAIDHVMNSSDEDFKANFSNYFDLYSVIDYYCFSYLTCHLDGLSKNMLIATYDGIHWGACLYDMDSIYGAHYDGNSFVSPQYKCPEEYQETRNLLFERLKKCFAQEIYDRYFELRKGALSLGNIITHVEEIYNLIPDRVLKDDEEKWPLVPQRNTNTITRFRNYMKDRAAYVDFQMEDLIADHSVSSIEITANSSDIKVGNKLILTAKITPENATIQTGVWTVDNDNVILDDSTTTTCKVTGNKVGNSIITFTSNDTTNGIISDTFAIEVAENTSSDVNANLVKYIDLAIDNASEKPTTITDKIDSTIYEFNNINEFYNNIGKDNVGWKTSGMRTRNYASGVVGIKPFQYEVPNQFTIENCMSFDDVSSVCRIMSVRNSWTDMIFQMNYASGVINIQNGAGKTYKTEQVLNTNTLYHFAVTYDGNSIRVFLNGSEILSSSELPNTLWSSTTFYVEPFGIANGSAIESCNEGLNCYFKIYNIVLDDATILSNYTTESNYRIFDL